MAATNTGAGRSSIQVSSVPTIRRTAAVLSEAPPPSPALPANPFSSSSSHNTAGAMAATLASARRRFASLLPTSPASKAATSSRTSGNPRMRAATRAVSDFPHPCTPSSSTPRGGRHAAGLGLRGERRGPLAEPLLQVLQAADGVAALVQAAELQEVPAPHQPPLLVNHGVERVVGFLFESQGEGPAGGVAGEAPGGVHQPGAFGVRRGGPGEVGGGVEFLRQFRGAGRG